MVNFHREGLIICCVFYFVTCTIVMAITSFRTDMFISRAHGILSQSITCPLTQSVGYCAASFPGSSCTHRREPGNEVATVYTPALTNMILALLIQSLASAGDCTRTSPHQRQSVGSPQYIAMCVGHCFEFNSDCRKLLPKVAWVPEALYPFPNFVVSTRVTVVAV